MDKPEQEKQTSERGTKESNVKTEVNLKSEEKQVKNEEKPVDIVCKV